MLESDTSNTAATTLEVVYEVALAGKFSGRKVFVEELEKAVPHFYQEAGQLLKSWTPPPPEISKIENDRKALDEEALLQKSLSRFSEYGEG